MTSAPISHELSAAEWRLPRSRLPLILLLVPVVLHTSGASAANASPPSSPVDSIARSVMAEHRLPSLSIAVAREGKIIDSKAYGLADLENGVPASVKTVYPLGSVTKTVTAAAALRLAEQGTLDLDVAIGNYCPAFPETQHAITVRRLLAHLGGVRHYDYRRFEEDFLNTKRFRSIDEALSKFATDPLVAEPGTKFHYSSWGYVLAGCALEGAAGSSYAEIIEAAVLQPSEMKQTTLGPSGELIPHRARGYSAADDGSWRTTVCFDASDRLPAGGLFGTPADFARFGIALLTGRILSPASLETMWSMQKTPAGEPTGAGLGWSVSEDGSEVFHGGTTVGGTAYLYIRPRDQIVVAFATNLSLWTDGRHELAQKLADLAMVPATAEGSSPSWSFDTGG